MQIKTQTQNLQNYKIYLQVEKAVRKFLEKKGYLPVDLPVMSPALIPESYLEIFETEFRYFKRREKLYLTPSPELFLKRLLVAGVGDCYYLGKAFRNSEPNSSFHLPEYTMLEYYRVGFTYLQLADEILEMMDYIATRLKTRTGISFKRWEKYTVAAAFEKFSEVSGKELFDEELFMKRARKKGYATEGFTYQDIFSQIIAQEIEPKLGKNGSPSLLYDYPPQMSSLAKLADNKKVAKRVEFYINGIEVGGCCEELTDWREQDSRFKTEELKREKQKMIHHAIDKGFIKALQYGLQDCCGAGIGFDRLAMVFTNTSSLDQLKLITIEQETS